MKNLFKESIFFIVVILVVAFGLKLVNFETTQASSTIPFSEVYSNLEKGQLKSITFTDRNICRMR